MTLKEDFLENDNPIPGQKYGCISFVSPINMVEKRELFYMREFFKKNCQELGIDQEKALSFLEKYDDFKHANEETMKNIFDEENDSVCNVYGFKVRGVYETLREAQVRGEVLRRKDPNFDNFLFQVGYWCPWHPRADLIQDEQYAESQLNDLVKNYKLNQEQKEEFFASEKRDRNGQQPDDIGITIDANKNPELNSNEGETSEETTELSTSSVPNDLKDALFSDNIERKKLDE